MTDPEIVQGLQVIKPKYQLEDADERFERTRAVIDAAISRLSATCETCRWHVGTPAEVRCVNPEFGGRMPFRPMFAPEDFGCNQHTPRPTGGA